MLRTGLFLSHQTTLVAAALLLSPAAFAQTRPAAGPAPVTAQPVTQAPPPVAAPATVADECIPACRAGYICARGQCVSSCNPPCAANEVCTSTGQCVATAPAPAAAPAATAGAPAAGVQPGYVAPAGAAAQPGAQQMDVTTPEPPPADKQMPEIRTFSFVPRIGLQGGGSVTYEFKCEGATCADLGDENESIDLDLGTALAFGGDFMFKLGDLFRIGPGLTHTLTTKASYQGVSQDAGSITEINFVAEVIPRVSPIVWLVPRLQTGLTMFSATGPVKEMINANKDVCTSDKSAASDYGVNVDCSNYDNPHLGFNIGLGFGAMFAVSPTVRLRADAMYQYFDVSLGTEEGSGNGINFKRTFGLSGSRYLLMGGAEF